jgi:hypothetical protein
LEYLYRVGHSAKPNPKESSPDEGTPDCHGSQAELTQVADKLKEGKNIVLSHSALKPLPSEEWATTL